MLEEKLSACIRKALSSPHELRSKHVYTAPELGWAAIITVPHLDTVTKPQVPKNVYNVNAYLCLSFRSQGTEENGKSGMLDQALAMLLEA